MRSRSTGPEEVSRRLGVPKVGDGEGRKAHSPPVLGDRQLPGRQAGDKVPVKPPVSERSDHSY